ncbi:MAG: hypothetical protein KJ955_02260 [Nanoarchaeota archaeon]|nr:hypothetical protein [Nanoarchaeota archaeon]
MEFETKTSYKYLKEVICALDEPICILGGWAVMLHVNRAFQKAIGKPYLGSRDIDLGFNLSSNSRTLTEAIKVLEKLRFKRLTFRMFKEVHTETEEEISIGQKIPAHFIFPIYVDFIVDKIPAGFKKEFGFQPIDEPLLKQAFEGKYTNVKAFGKKVMLPHSELLIAMKINCLPSRDKEHKKIKDICDLFTLLWYGNAEKDSIKSEVLKYVSAKNIKKCISCITKSEMEKVGMQLGHPALDIERVLGLLR